MSDLKFLLSFELVSMIFTFIPDFGRDADDWIEHAIQVEVSEKALDPNTVDSERHLWDTQV